MVGFEKRKPDDIESQGDDIRRQLNILASQTGTYSGLGRQNVGRRNRLHPGETVRVAQVAE